MKKFRKGSGLSLIEILVSLVCLSILGMFARKGYEKMLEYSRHNTLITERNHIAQNILKNVDCDRSLATSGIVDEATQCTTNNTSVLPYFELRGRVTVDHPAGIPIGDTFPGGGGYPLIRSGNWTLRTSCFLRVSGATTKRCLLIEAARLRDINPTDFYRDPYTKQDQSWHSLFDIPFCCDLPM